MTEVPTEIRRTTRDPGELRSRLQAWLRTRHADAEVGEVTTTSATGMSSDTLLFDASWSGNGPVPLVARLAPASQDVPVFPAYDLAAQAALIRRVAAERAAWSNWAGRWSRSATGRGRGTRCRRGCAAPRRTARRWSSRSRR